MHFSPLLFISMKGGRPTLVVAMELCLPLLFALLLHLLLEDISLLLDPMETLSDKSVRFPT